jgi:hypothetical protein
MQDPLVVEFVSITGSDESTAARLLRVHNNSLVIFFFFFSLFCFLL